ncbi:hypothetical protein NPIL_240762 [Nephila pilipes]|uniref:Uncharacterized protein n=1 Tax=Nephila pilipes TaxID=299642 RepID=A0A8X6QIV5_NEPPI|nr:hypothetical protein NPIL_240762 [Nephila pilipes]
MPGQNESELPTFIYKAYGSTGFIIFQLLMIRRCISEGHDINEIIIFLFNAISFCMIFVYFLAPRLHAKQKNYRRVADERPIHEDPVQSENYPKYFHNV